MKLKFEYGFTREAAPSSPGIKETASGLGLTCEYIHFGNNSLKMRIFCTCCLDGILYDRFRLINNAISFTVENADTGEYCIAPLIEPGMVFKGLKGPNFDGVFFKGENPESQSWDTFWINAPLVLNDVPEPENNPSLFFTVNLLSLCSNTIAIDLKTGNVTSLPEEKVT